MFTPSQMRHRVGAQKPAPHAGAPARRNGDDDDEWGYMTVGGIVCLFLLLAVGATAVALTSILVRRSVPRSALNALCDDENVCTWDVLETVHGATAGICSHYNYQNGGDCTDACYAAATSTCQDGECKGTCRGHCEESNALDCPIVSSVNLTALFGHGRGTDGAADTATLYRECLLSGCVYSIVLDINNATLSQHDQSDFVHSIRRIFDYQSAATASNNSAIGSHLANFDDQMFEFRIVCMSLIHPDDRDCLQTIRFEYNDQSNNNCTGGGIVPCLIDIECSYMFKCTDPPSYAGELEFPILGKQEFLPK